MHQQYYPDVDQGSLAPGMGFQPQQQQSFYQPQHQQSFNQYQPQQMQEFSQRGHSGSLQKGLTGFVQQRFGQSHFDQPQGLFGKMQNRLGQSQLGQRLQSAVQSFMPFRQPSKLDASTLKKISNDSYYYYGQVDEDNKREGVGLLMGKLFPFIYLGGWCDGVREGFGITIGRSAEFGVSPLRRRFEAKGGIWRNGMLVDPVPIPPHLKVHVKSAMKSHSMQKKLKCLLPMLPPVPRDCHTRVPFVDIDEVVSFSGWQKKRNQKATKGFKGQLYKSQYQAIQVPFSEPAFVQTFSLEANYRPGSILYQKDGDGSFREISRGFDFGVNFQPGVVYVVETGCMDISDKNDRIYGTAVTGKFAVLLGRKSMYQQWKDAKMEILTNYRYTLKFAGEVRQYEKTGSGKYLLGRFAHNYGPLFKDGKLHYYFTGGDKCGNVPRNVELVISCSQSSPAGNGLALHSVTEPSTCHYVAEASSSFCEHLSHLLPSQ